jgi:hypothetical protein
MNLASKAFPSPGLQPNENKRKTVRCIRTVALCFIVLASIGGSVGRRGHESAPKVAASSQGATLSPAQVREAYGRLPLSFEANHGQADASFDFAARGAGYTLGLSSSEAIFVLARRSKEESKRAKLRSRTLRMKLVGADDSASSKGVDQLPGTVNYFLGSDPSRWRTDISTYKRIGYGNVYPGVDIVYYGNQRQLEYDFIIAPGSDAKAIKLQFDGADKVEVNGAGDLLLSVGESVIRQPKPVVYQEVGGERLAVQSNYTVGRTGQVGFALGEYDARLPLVIDPTIVYSTYIGGSGGEQGLAFALDSAGNAYITGFTNSTNFPTANAFQSANGGFQDAFVTKINAAGTAFVYSTYLGGSSGEQARGIAVDSSGNAYVTGFTGSTNFPIVNAFKSTLGTDEQDAFVTKINATGSALVYSTYLGGSGDFNSADY